MIDQGKLKLNLGCGSRKREGYVNVDMFPDCRPDVVLNLEQTPWPWPDDSVIAVDLIHVLEHLGQQPAVFLGIMKELWRVCCDGAMIHIEVPHPRSDEFLGDPTHVRSITGDTLALFNQCNCAEYEKLGAANTPLGKYLGVDFEIASSTLQPKPQWLERLQRGQIGEADLRAAGDSQWNVYSSVQFELRVIKPAGRRLAPSTAARGAPDLGPVHALLAGGRVAEARAGLEALCAQFPSDPEVRCTLAAVQHALSDLDGARQNYQAAIDAGGCSRESYNNLGVVCLDLGETEAAMRSFDAALRYAPGDRVLRRNLAEAKAASGAVRDAIGLFTTLIEEQPDDPDTYLEMAKVMLDQGWFSDAENALQMALRFGADSLELFNQTGIARREQYRYSEAVEAFDAGLAVAPDCVPLLVNRANALGWSRQDEAAEAAYRRALALAPEDVQARFSFACFLLMRGRTDEGWDYYEARWERGDRARTRRPVSCLAQWCGEDSDPTRDALLVFSEQGFGDNLQFVRLLARIRQRFARITLLTRPALQSLLSRSLAGIADVVVEHPDEAGFRWQVPLLSIARAVKLPVSDWTMDSPYLKSDPVKAVPWATHLPANGRRRVGLCWSGGKLPRYRSRFDLPLEAVDSMLAEKGIAWVNLQQAGFDEWRQDRVNAGAFVDPMPLVRDFDDTAALVSGLDLVISTDTAVAHLAGAMGKPVWLLLSSEGEWRWLQDRTDTPWYPTMRIFRQAEAGNWSGVVEAVRQALAERR